MRDGTISLIIPVLHESDTIQTLIQHLSAQQAYETCELIVVDGSPLQDTIAALSTPEVITIASDPGRARQMNAGAAVARGEYLIFLHADTFLPDNALATVRGALHNRLYVGGAFDLGIRSERPVFRVIAHIASLRSRLTRIPYGDQAIFIRRDYFNLIGGYRDIPIAEDIELMQRIKKRGDKICILSDTVATSPRRWEREGIIRCTIRNWAIALLFCCGVSPLRLVRFYNYEA